MATPRKTTRKLNKSEVQNHDAEARLAGFLAKYDPEIEALARDARKRMQARLPGANRTRV